MNIPPPALVLFSGGQDSTVCLADALAGGARVETIGFDYGQRHRVELEARLRVREAIVRQFPDWAAQLGPDHMVPIEALKTIGGTALTGEAEIRMTEEGLPSTFVPGRNLLFFTFAAAVAWRRDIKRLVGGMCETDFSGYPDCRDDTLKALQVAINLGTNRRFVVETPLMWIDKAATWRLAEDIGGPALVELIVEETHTCYLGERGQRHLWGYGCGTCPACELRANGYQAYVRHRM